MGRRKKKEARQSSKRKPKEKELTEGKNVVEYTLKPTPKTESGVSERLPLYMRENLPASALRLLDYYGTFPQNKAVLTSNCHITDNTGIRSDTTIAAAEKALTLSKVIYSSKARGPGGVIVGKYIVFRGIPDETPDIARGEYVKALEKHLEQLHESVAYFEKRVLRTAEKPDHKSEDERLQVVAKDLAVEDSEEKSE